MSILSNSAIIGLLGAPEAAGGGIERSVRFNSSDSGFLSRTPASAGNRRTWSFSCWVKRAALGAFQAIIAGDDAIGGGDVIGFSSNDELRLSWNGAINGDAITLAKFRDPSAWYHIAVAIDTTQATDTNRVKVYVNGVQQTLTAGPFGGTYGTYPAQNYDTEINTATAQWIGRSGNTYSNFYLADVHFIDGQALDPTSFGEFDDNGIWQPIAYSGGSYGTNGFHLPFDDNSTAAALGTDTSGNGNTWTVNNISVAAGAGNDSLVDVPTNGTETDTGVGGEVRGNYATLNPLDKSSNITLANGNLDYTQTTSNGIARSTLFVSSGKWYWEYTSNGTYGLVGIANSSNPLSDSYLGSSANGYSYLNSGSKVNSGSITSYGASWTSGDVIGIALDLDAGTLVFYKNGISQGTAFSSLSGSFSPAAGANNTNMSGSFNFGARSFAYTAPSGFKALCTANLDAPLVTKPSEYMDVVTYTGNGGTQTISGLDFSPDLAWIKARSTNHDHMLYDTVRGDYKKLNSNTTDAESTNTNQLSFESDGFSLGNATKVNESSTTFAAWTWDAGSSTVSNTDGSITSSVRANATAGFSIIAFTCPTSGGSYPSYSVGHGLGVAPTFFVAKDRSNGTTSWITYHASVTDTVNKYLVLNGTGAVATASNIWGTALPSSTVINLTANTGIVPGSNAVIYAFAPVDGYSSFGSYVGNGSSDGPMVYTGFRPRFLLIKSSSAAYWVIRDAARDNYNATTKELFPNDSLAETVVPRGTDFLSNGFKLRHSGTTENQSGQTYIYAAFAEHPFQYARAR